MPSIVIGVSDGKLLCRGMVGPSRVFSMLRKKHLKHQMDEPVTKISCHLTKPCHAALFAAYLV